MIEPRIYRAAFIPALLVVVTAMFSLESRPPPLPQALAADVLFDGPLARATAEQLIDRYPDRRAGTSGARSSAAFVRESLESRGFEVEVDEFEEQGKDLYNVVGRRTGTSERRVAVVAARDARSVPDAGASAADTAALLEFGRVLGGRSGNATVVAASVDGSTLGDAGVRRLVDRLEEPELIDAILVLSNLGAGSAGSRAIVAWSNDTRRAGIGLERTLEASLGQELDRPRDAPSWRGQLAHLAFPLGIGAQGVLLDHGLDAVRLSGTGELPPPAGSTGLEEVNEERLGELGRAGLRAVSAIDAHGRPEAGPETYVTVAGQVVPGWALRLLSLALLAPALLAAVDAFARARRRREPVAPWVRWLLGWTLPFVCVLPAAAVLTLSGLMPDAPRVPFAPALHPLDAAAVVALVLVAALCGLAQAGRLRLLGGSPAGRDGFGGPCATALVLSVTVLLVWIANPYAALVLVPAAHLWMLAILPKERPSGGGRALLVAGGLVAPVAVAIYYLVRLSLDPLEGVWYLLLLASGGHVDLLTALVCCLLLAVLVAVIVLAATRRASTAPSSSAARADGPPVRGPASYAGPGSLGGTDSALRR